MCYQGVKVYTLIDSFNCRNIIKQLSQIVAIRFTYSTVMAAGSAKPEITFPS